MLIFHFDMRLSMLMPPLPRCDAPSIFDMHLMSRRLMRTSMLMPDVDHMRSAAFACHFTRFFLMFCPCDFYLLMLMFEILQQISAGADFDARCSMRLIRDGRAPAYFRYCCSIDFRSSACASRMRAAHALLPC